MDQEISAALGHPVCRCGFIHISPFHLALALLVGLAGLAHLPGYGKAIGQWLCQKVALPSRLPNVLAELEVFGVSEAQLVTVDQQCGLVPGFQDGGVGHAVGVAGLDQILSNQKVSVAHHDAQVQALASGGQYVNALRLIGGGAKVIADPGLKQVAQDQNGICLGAGQVLLQACRGGRQAGVQVNVRDEINAPPRGRCIE